ncbi:hypothetical protein VIGAN_09121700 [Vigna angularis var. angularis]|uniref:Thioesterase domain-containing protein n=1 Tax=Vigna angularis var. angularis TaxID=157739 RepID=A0A0S3SY07_PHAAN|nr:hypothetical protein VIGAN_09121700 [Vigna angularis var. angularis]
MMKSFKVLHGGALALVAEALASIGASEYVARGSLVQQVPIKFSREKSFIDDEGFLISLPVKILDDKALAFTPVILLGYASCRRSLL